MNPGFLLFCSLIIVFSISFSLSNLLHHVCVFNFAQNETIKEDITKEEETSCIGLTVLSSSFNREYSCQANTAPSEIQGRKHLRTINKYTLKLTKNNPSICIHWFWCFLTDFPKVFTYMLVMNRLAILLLKSLNLLDKIRRSEKLFPKL